MALLNSIPVTEPKKMSTTLRIQPATTTAISSAINRTLLRHHSLFPRPHRYHRRRALTVSAAAASAPLEICVKASVTTPNKLGDCEFSLQFFLISYYVPKSRKRNVTMMLLFQWVNCVIFIYDMLFRSILSESFAYYGGKASTL